MESADLLIQHATLITMDETRRILPDGVLVVRGDRILAVGTAEEMEGRYQATRVIDARNRYVFPGFANTHSHLFQGALKGLGRDKTLFDWLDSSVRFALPETGYDVMYAAALVGCIENLRSGTTTLLDYQYAHAHEAGLDDAVTRAMEETGIRGILGRAHTDVSRMPEGAQCPRVETEQDFFDDVDRLQAIYKDHSRISVCLAPGIIWDLTEEGYRTCRQYADRYGMVITMHTLETEDDNRYSQETYGMNTMPFLARAGVLGPDFLAVHCVDMDEEDFRLFREYDIKVSHNPISNMILASGVAPVPRMLREGLTVSLASDGSASNDTQDMMEVLKTSALIHKCHLRDATAVPAATALEMATLGGARATGLEKETGSLSAGKKADFWIMNPLTARCVPVADPVSAVVYHASQQNVETTVVDGRVVLDHGKITTVDEEAALWTLQEAAFRLREKVGLGNTQWNQPVQVGPFVK